MTRVAQAPEGPVRFTQLDARAWRRPLDTSSNRQRPGLAAGSATVAGSVPQVGALSLKLASPKYCHRPAHERRARE